MRIFMQKGMDRRTIVDWQPTASATWRKHEFNSGCLRCGHCRIFNPVWNSCWEKQTSALTCQSITHSNVSCMEIMLRARRFFLIRCRSSGQFWWIKFLMEMSFAWAQQHGRIVSQYVAYRMMHLQLTNESLTRGNAPSHPVVQSWIRAEHCGRAKWTHTGKNCGVPLDDSCTWKLTCMSRVMYEQ